MNNQIDYGLSFTACAGVPAKLLKSINLGAEGKIHPLHAGLNPTNKCNLACYYCGCQNRDLSSELPFDDVRQMLFILKDLLCGAITITGGGEPFLYGKINELIDLAAMLGIKIGIITNGTLLNRLAHSWPSWVRISFSDDRKMETDFFDQVERAVNKYPNIDWAFSYVLSATPDYQKIEDIISFAADHSFSHVRVKPDMLDEKAGAIASSMPDELKTARGADILIWQGQKPHTRGAKKCMAGLLLPNIYADGNIYPCCGVEYAKIPPDLRYKEKFSLGSWKNLRKIIENQSCFDGSICDKCYYNDYNITLNAITKKVMHPEFI